MIKVKMVNGGEQAAVTFTLPGRVLDGDMAVVGDFNDWDPTATPMRKRRGAYTATAQLETGRRYAFLYQGEDGDFFWDEAADGYEPGPYGADNCILDLTGPR